MVTTSPTKNQFMNLTDSQFALDAKEKAVVEANKQCQIGKNWIDWDDLYSETFGKSSHGYYAQVFRTYQGMSNTFGNMCLKCPKIMQDAWKEIRNEERSQRN